MNEDPESNEEPVGRRTAPDSRHRGREVALQMLYQWHVAATGVDDVMTTYGAIEQVSDDQPGPRARVFADDLLRGTIGRLTEIDTLIAQQTEHWRPSRLSTVDRQILRLAVYELLAGDSPPRVVINEAVELARTFSGEDATAFVNGVLDGLRRRFDANAGEVDPQLSS